MRPTRLVRYTPARMAMAGLTAGVIYRAVDAERFWRLTDDKGCQRDCFKADFTTVKTGAVAAQRLRDAAARVLPQVLSWLTLLSLTALAMLATGFCLTFGGQLAVALWTWLEQVLFNLSLPTDYN